jgi:hypothetical protein
LYQELCKLDTELKVDGYVTIWNHVLDVVEFNKTEMEKAHKDEEEQRARMTPSMYKSRPSRLNPFRETRKTQSVIDMREAFQNSMTHYVELENVFIKKVLVYISGNSVYKNMFA